MIDLIVFNIFICTAIYGFVFSWQKGSVKDGLLSILLVCLLFTICYPLVTTIAKIYPKNEVLFMNRDTFALLLMLLPLRLFYNFYLKQKN